MTIKIERATLNDLHDIQVLNNKLFDYEIKNFDPDLVAGWPLTDAGAKYFTDMIEKQFVLVAKDDNRAIGYFAGTIGFEIPITKGPLAEMDNMYIDEEYQSRGIGKQFVEKFIAECKSRGIYAIRVSASAKNSGAIAFYERQGFLPKNATHDLKLG